MRQIADLRPSVFIFYDNLICEDEVYAEPAPMAHL